MVLGNSNSRDTSAVLLIPTVIPRNRLTNIKTPYKVCAAPLNNAQFYCTIVIARRRVNGVSFPLRGHSLKLTSFLLSPYFLSTFPTHVFPSQLRSKSLETHQPLFNQLLTTKKNQMDGVTDRIGFSFTLQKLQ